MLGGQGQRFPCFQISCCRYILIKTINNFVYLYEGGKNNHTVPKMLTIMNNPTLKQMYFSVL